MRDLTKSTPGPWSYRSEYHDDWGVVRGPTADLGLEWIVAVADAGRRVDSREYAAHRENGTDPYEANARLITAAPAFLAACQGTDPDVTALEWLASVLADLEAAQWPSETTDPEAAWTGLKASWTLLAALRAAVAQATEEK
jgi:hypothetical protein